MKRKIGPCGARRVVLLLLLGGGLVLPIRSLARWETPADNKPVAVLEGMNSEQLFNEALDVCVGRALVERPPPAADPITAPAPSAASLYLQAIAGVAAHRNGGTVPPWIDILLSARTGKQCQRGLHSFLGGGTAEAADASLRRSRPRARLHQLPPWLAPH
ncbi:MAG TPA: hypothetical protein VN812_06740 [Candidatus Acidoferrales bacterium]|nr:hypothetical protein [Candidatus Acidoferrales bacterium]